MVVFFRVLGFFEAENGRISGDDPASATKGGSDREAVEDLSTGGLLAQT